MARHRATEGSTGSADPARGASAVVTTRNGRSRKKDADGKPWWKPPLSNGVWLLRFFLIFLVLWLGGCSTLLLWVRSG